MALSQDWITATHTCDVPILWVLLGFTSSVFCLVGGMVWFTNASWVAPTEETLTLVLRMLLGAAEETALTLLISGGTCELVSLSLEIEL